MGAIAVSVFEYVGRHATRFLGAGVLVGLLVPALAHLLSPLMVPFLIIPLMLALVRMDWSGFASIRRRPWLAGLIVLWLLIASPVVVWAALRAAPVPFAIKQAVILMAAASPIVSSAAFSMLIGLDAALAVVIILVTTALVPLTLPPVAMGLLGVQIDLDIATFMTRLALMVGVTFAAAIGVRAWVPRERIERNARVIDGFTVFNLVLLSIAIMDGVTALALDRPGYVIAATLWAFAANLVLQVTGTALFWRLGARPALTVGLMTGNCNLGLVIVALGGGADFDVIVFFAMAQLPIYMLPGLLMPVYRRLLEARR